MIPWLKKHRVLICAGTGGVGKTTLSASLGILAARQGIRTLVLTIDPALRLAQALGVEQKAGEAVAVPGVPGLSATMIDPRRVFDEFVLGSVDNVVAKGLFDNRLYQQLVSNLNGSQEFTSLLCLLSAAKSGKYDLVILDTPPMQNAVDFLKAPERIYALFQDTVIGWFSDAGEKQGWIKRTISRGSRIVTGALENATGSVFIHELKDFFSHIAHLQKKVAVVSAEVGGLLHAKDTGFVLVTGFDETKLKEAVEFQSDLAQEDLNLRAVIVNRWFPEWSTHSVTQNPAWSADPDYTALKVFYDRFSSFFEHRQAIYEHFEAQIGRKVPVMKLPDFNNNVLGIEDLEKMSEVLRLRWEPRK